MPHLEYSKANHSFDEMKKLNELYETEEYFSNKVLINEPEKDS